MSSENPFAAPEESHAPATDGELTIAGMQVASQNRRFCNFLIDTIIVRIGSFGGGMVLGTSYAALGRPLTPAENTQMTLYAMAIGLVIFLVYFAGSELLLGGATIGKLITGTRAVQLDGSSPTFGQILGRSLSRMIPFEPLSFVFGDKTTGWHDSLSNTRVVRKI